MKNLVHIGESDISIKEYKGQRVVTFKDIDAVHGRPEGTASRNFRSNKEHFVENEDFYKLSQPDEIRRLGFARPQGGTPSEVVLLTEQGYLMLVKSFTDDLAWSIQRQLVNSYFRVRQIVDDRLSPETKMLYQMINQIAQSEIKAKEAKELAQKAVETTEHIKEAVQPVFENWRETINQKFSRIQKNSNKSFLELYSETYQILEKRAGCDLGARVRNKKNRMENDGCTKTQISSINKISIIEEDKKLREIFSKIVTEYEIKYCA